jgi:hypothetical protein
MNADKIVKTSFTKKKNVAIEKLIKGTELAQRVVRRRTSGCGNCSELSLLVAKCEEVLPYDKVRNSVSGYTLTGDLPGTNTFKQNGYN